MHRWKKDTAPISNAVSNVISFESKEDQNTPPRATPTEANLETAYAVGIHLQELFNNFKEAGGWLPITEDNPQIEPGIPFPGEAMPISKNERRIVMDAAFLMHWNLCYGSNATEFRNGIFQDYIKTLENYVTKMEEALFDDPWFLDKAREFRENEETGLAAFYREITLGAELEQFFQKEFH